MNEKVLHKNEWYIKSVPITIGLSLIKEHHYAKSGSKTCVFMHGLYNKETNKLHGVAQWLPPIQACSLSVNRSNWRQVLALSRLVIIPDTPKNACSFLLSGSIKLIAKDGRFTSLVTFADESEGHSGVIYKASNWDYHGLTRAYPKWKTKSGELVCAKSTVNRSVFEMEFLGYIRCGSYKKHKFVKHLRR